jgi:putative hydrolase
MPIPNFNAETARIFRECAEILRGQKANPFRINAYLHAAQTLESLRVDARDILEKDGIDGLIRLPAIGKGLAAAIDEIARTGRLTQLDRLRGEAQPETLFQVVPGIGPKLAATIHEALHIETLEALEMAAHDGRLDAIPGIGERRAAAIRAGLAALLTSGRKRPTAARASPAVEILLDVDEEYRRRAAAGKLPKIAPKRFNPAGEAWLPILHAKKNGWHFTALFSNTARAHELGMTDDWVVLYYYDDHHEEGQNTIVTETHGPLKGKRVVRGREAECRALATAVS